MFCSSAVSITPDAIWLELEKALKKAQHSAAGDPGKQSDWEFLEAELHLQRTGSPWRDLPAELGFWHAVYMRFRRWEARGVWTRLWQNLQAEPFAGARGLLLDSTTVRAHPHAAGAPQKNGPDQALGRSRGGWSTKLHAATLDENSRPSASLPCPLRRLGGRAPPDPGPGARWPPI